MVGQRRSAQCEALLQHRIDRFTPVPPYAQPRHIQVPVVGPVEDELIPSGCVGSLNGRVVIDDDVPSLIGCPTDTGRPNPPVFWPLSPIEEDLTITLAGSAAPDLKRFDSEAATAGSEDHAVALTVMLHTEDVHAGVRSTGMGNVIDNALVVVSA